MPFADAHKFWSGDATETAYVPDLVRPGPIEGMLTVNYGGGGEETRLVCGYLELSEFLFAPVFRTLPEVLVEHTGEARSAKLIASTVREIIALVDAATPGSQLMLGPADGDAVRRGSAPPYRPAAIRQPRSGSPRSTIRSSDARFSSCTPIRGKRWTAESLAREAGSSRTVLAERFNALLGRPPIDYVTSWRIQLAGERLRATEASIGKIGSDVGYESEAAFNRAFKRVTGVTPGRWREGVSPDPLAAKAPIARDAGVARSAQ